MANVARADENPSADQAARSKSDDFKWEVIAEEDANQTPAHKVTTSPNTSREKAMRDIPPSLPTGARIADDMRTQGRGILILHNGNGFDAAVRVISLQDGTTVRWVFVDRRDEIRLTGIEPGSYEVLVTLGLDWSENERSFKLFPTYERLDKKFKFEEIEKADGTLYDKRTIYLNPVSDGNLTYHHIGEAEFRQGLPNRRPQRKSD